MKITGLAACRVGLIAECSPDQAHICSHVQLASLMMNAYNSPRCHCLSAFSADHLPSLTLARQQPAAWADMSPWHLQVGQNIEQTYAAELLWIDKQGIYLSVLTAAADAATVCRVTFHRPVLEERDARSVLTLLAQVAWERERSYVPSVPASSTSV